MIFSLTALSSLLTGSLSLVGLLLIFTLAVTDSFAFIGFVVPGSAIATLLGGLTYAGTISFSTLMLVLVTGAIAGDMLSYSLGRWVGIRLVSTNVSWRARVVKAERLLQKGLIPALVVDRFVLPFRPVMAFAAGATGFSFGYIIVLSLILNTLFMFGYVSIGYYLAAGVSVVAFSFNPTSVTVFLTMLFIGFFWLAAYLTLLIRREDIVYFKRVLIAMYDALSHSRVVHAVTGRYPAITHTVSQFLQSVLSKHTPFIIAGVISIFLLLFIFDTTLDVVIPAEPEVIATDLAVESFLSARTVAWLTDLMLVVTKLGGTTFVITLSLLGFGWLYRRRQAALAWVSLGSIGAALAITYGIKLAIARPRPALSQFVETTFSFPSGHATGAILIFGLATYLLIRSKVARKIKIYGSYALVALILLIGFSRIYLGVHYVSDVLVGFAVGGVGLVVIIYLNERMMSLYKRL